MGRHPSGLTDEDVLAHWEDLSYHATQGIGKHFPKWRIGTYDHIQNAFLRILQIRPQPNETAADLYSRRQAAGCNGMIDGIRQWQDYRHPHGRRVEFIVDNLAGLQNRIAIESHEDAVIVRVDCQRLIERVAGQLSSTQRAVLLGRLRGDTLQELADRLGYTEGRICQLEKQVIRILRAAMEHKPETTCEKEAA